MKTTKITHQRSTKSVQGDTLDLIAYRVFGDLANRYLPLMIAQNARLCPHAIIPTGTQVILPNDDKFVATPTLKLWD